jgi:hypothetical protein
LASARDSGSDARERDPERKDDKLVLSTRSPAAVEANSEEPDPEREVIGLEVEQPPAAGIVATSEAMVAAVS